MVLDSYYRKYQIFLAPGLESSDLIRIFDFCLCEAIYLLVGTFDCRDR